MTQHAAEVPAGMEEVSEDQFFLRLNADPRDIMPTTEEPLRTNWRRNGGYGGTPWGISYPGWKNPGDEQRYFVHPAR